MRLGDVARVELGAENYGSIIRVNGHPGAGIAISLAPGADALKTAELVKAACRSSLRRTSPTAINYAYANDTTDFIKLSVEEVVKTLIEAIVLVVLVMFVFLQSWRATAGPGDRHSGRAARHLRGLLRRSASRSTRMTLFGLALAVGLLVDDAIVVVENVERLLDENPEMTPREATIESMGEIQIALIAIALVLSAVFLPMAFFGGSTGVIYRQFSLDHRLGDGAVGVRRAGPQPGARPRPFFARRTRAGRQAGWLDRRAPAIGTRDPARARLVQHRLRAPGRPVPSRPSSG